VRAPQFAVRLVMLTALLLLTGGVAQVMPAAAAVRTGPEVPGAAFAVSGSLSAVAATSADNAWAVGSSGGRALIVRWNGAAWKRVPGPAPAGSLLSGVSGTSARNAWAVGCTDCSGSGVAKPLILRWNGTMWKQAASPSLAGSLSSVAATSAGNAWAVGSTSTGRTLIERWNGTAWKRVSSPSPGSTAYLGGVAASSAGSAWAVGSTFSGGFTGTDRTLIERWNGTAWKQVPSPSPDLSEGLADFLGGVAVTSADSAWAVGDANCGCGPGINVTERWNGTAWKQVPSPSPGGGALLSGVAAVSARTVWAVGVTGSGDGPTKTLTLWWNGTGWKRVASPSPGASASLSAVAVTSARNAWAVGSTSTVNHGSPETLILRWNGSTWK
jgi:hypothetical protein